MSLVKKLEIDHHPDTDDRWAYLVLRQEGSPGFEIPVAYISEFVGALENATNDKYYFWMNYNIVRTSNSCTLNISTRDVPILRISLEQCAKLIVHLKDKYSL